MAGVNVKVNKLCTHQVLVLSMILFLEDALLVAALSWCYQRRKF